MCLKASRLSLSVRANAASAINNEAAVSSSMFVPPLLVHRPAAWLVCYQRCGSGLLMLQHANCTHFHQESKMKDRTQDPTS